MSLPRFWRNIQAVSAFLQQAKPTGESKSDIWLLKRAVDGFDSQDFSVLSHPERDALAQHVEDFRAAINRLELDGAEAHQRLADATQALQGILKILRPNDYSSPEEFIAAKTLEAFPKPDWVRRLIYAFDLDATGDPGIWIWIIADDEAARLDGFFQMNEDLSDRIRLALRQEGVEFWPHIRVRTESEQVQLEKTRAW